MRYTRKNRRKSRKSRRGGVKNFFRLFGPSKPSEEEEFASKILENEHDPQVMETIKNTSMNLKKLKQLLMEKTTFEQRFNPPLRDILFQIEIRISDAAGKEVEDSVY